MKIINDNRLHKGTFSATNESLNYPASNLDHPFLTKRFQATDRNSVVSIELEKASQLNAIGHGYTNAKSGVVNLYQGRDADSDVLIDESGNDDNGTLTGFDPIAEYHFEDDLIDANGNTTYDLTAPNGCSYDTGGLGTDKCVVLASASFQYLRGTLMSFGTDNFEIDLWIKGSAPAAQQLVFDTRNDSFASGGVGILINLNVSGQLQFVIGDGSVSLIKDVTLSVISTTFQHFRFRVDRINNEMRAYVDNIESGSAVDISTITGSLDSGETYFSIGKNNFAASGYLDASIDDTRINGYALSIYEGQALVDRPQDPSYWVGDTDRYLSFNGKTSGITLPNIYIPDELTISFMANDDLDLVAGKYNYIFDAYSGTNRILIYTANGLTKQFGIFGFSAFSSAYYVSGTQMVSIRISTTEATLFIDGDEKQTIAISHTGFTPTKTYIGRSTGGIYGTGFYGRFRIDYKLLSNIEIYNYASLIEAPSEDPIIYYTCNGVEYYLYDSIDMDLSKDPCISYIDSLLWDITKIEIDLKTTEEYLKLGGIAAGKAYEIQYIVSDFERPLVDNSTWDQMPGGQSLFNHVKALRTFNPTFTYNRQIDVVNKLIELYFNLGIGNPVFIDFFEEYRDLMPPLYCCFSSAPKDTGQSSYLRQITFNFQECR